MVAISEVTWEQHFERLVNPGLMTHLLHDAIPVLRHVNWHVSEVDDGFCRTVLPLNAESTNQHGTHQAALMSLSADYTGGLALATLLRGVPLAGVHECQPEESASLWLAEMKVRYKKPSSGHLTAECRVAPEQAESICSRYQRGAKVLAPLHVEFLSNGDVVAVAEMKYFAQPSAQLESGDSAKRSALTEHKLKTSARMIAGLRALRSESSRIRISCPLAEIAAGPHGQLIAQRLQQRLPQLKEMVLARTQHIDETILAVEGVKQVVLLGAGLDMRPARLAKSLSDLMFFELDLPEMLAERDRIWSEVDEGQAIRRATFEADFLESDVAGLLLSHPDFDASLPTAFIFEGCSMYFSEEDNLRMLDAVRGLMSNPGSVMWVDFVNEEVASGQTSHQGVRQFLSGMTELGESFRFGLDDPIGWSRQYGFGSGQVITAAEYLGSEDPVLGTYNFSVFQL